MEKIWLNNMNVWKSVVNITFAEKVNYMADKIMSEKPLLVAIDEHSSNRKHIDDLSSRISDNYIVIEPVNWNMDGLHKKSLQNLLVLRKDIRYKVREDITVCLPNRINVVDVCLGGNNKMPITVVNCYMVQTTILKPHMRAERTELHNILWAEVKKIIEKIHGAIVLMGDFQEGSDGENIKYLKEQLGYSELVEEFNYAPIQTFNNKTIDHILFSKDAKTLLNPKNLRVDTDLYAISDHPLIEVQVA